MKLKRFLSLPIVAVVLLMGFMYYSTVFIFMEDWLGLRSSNGNLNFWVYTCFGFMCFLSFVSSVVIDPGNVPSGFSPDIEEDGSETETSINGFNKKAVSSKYCEKCSMHKPPRTHHCRVCRRCILRMDHHCMWINNCVGFANYKPFVIFIMYAAICCIYSMVIIIMSTLQRDSEIGERRYVKILYVSCRSLTAFLSLIMGSLLVWHIYLLSHNMTTIEYKEGKRAKWLAKKSGQNYRHPFDLGVYKNIISVLGPNMLKWFCPTAVGQLKDGINFPTSRTS